MKRVPTQDCLRKSFNTHLRKMLTRRLRPKQNSLRDFSTVPFLYKPNHLQKKRGSGVHPSPSAGGTSCSRRRRCCPPPFPAIVALNTIFEIRLPLNGRRMPKQSSIKKVHLQDLSEDRVALRYQSQSQWWQPKSTKRPSAQKKALYGCECRGRNAVGSRALRTEMRRESLKWKT